MKTSSQLKEVARKSLKGNYGKSIGAFLLTYLMSIIPFCSPSMMVGYSKYNLHLVRGEEAEIGDVFEGFNIFGKALWLMIVECIFISLWSILFTIPGIIKTFSYSMSQYYLADHPEMSAMEALNASRRLMDGKKGKLFYIMLSFIGWSILVSCTFGLAGLWVVPYMNATRASFYDNAITVTEDEVLTEKIGSIGATV